MKNKSVTQTPKKIMLAWFFENYENPVHHLPYDGKDGGYNYIYGGPYNAGDVLHAEFGGRFDEIVIDEAVNEIQDEGFDWSPVIKNPEK